MGSEFCVVLPKCDSDVPVQVEEDRSEQHDASLNGFVVVVIEDDDNTARAMTALLEECRCIAVVHPDADGAIAALTSQRLQPNAIIADYRLRVAQVIRDYGIDDRAEAPEDSRRAHDR